VEDAPFAKPFEPNGGYRIWTTTSQITHTYKYGGTWMPTEDLTARSFQRAVRAPNIVELFADSTWSVGGADPARRRLRRAAANAAQCVTPV
jgi:hypothetical protein